MTMTKVCGKCGLEKDFSQYKKQKNGKHGLYSICKDCVKEYRRAYYLAHHKEELSYRKEYCEENKDKILLYYKKNRNKLLSYKKEYRKKNRDKILPQIRGYNTDVRNKALDLYGCKCELCGSVDHLEFHHLNLDGVEERKVYSHKNLYKSLADGNKRSDLQLLCRSCHHKIHNDLRSGI